VIEWPRKISGNRISQVHAVTSDILPTLCALTGQSLPDGPIDGIDLTPVFEDEMSRRPKPIFFWSYDTGAETSVKRAPYIEPTLQEGTTPLKKKMDGKYTRTFRNLKHPKIRKSDYGGPRTLLGNRYKLVIEGEKGATLELFDIIADPYEKTNVAGKHPKLVERLQRELREWQDSVLNSLTGADY
jgi:arylsulfatase A-like enzyme